MTPLQLIQENESSKNGNAHAKRGQLGKVSCEELQQISKMPLTKTGTHNSRASTPPTTTQPLSKSSNISTQKWCPIDIHAKKNLRMAYYEEWDKEIHLKVFGKCLIDNQIRIKLFEITISYKDKLQFYLEQMYASNHFDMKQMTEWENKTVAIKDNFDKAKLYFEGLVRDYKVYAQNSGGTAGRYSFESANQATAADTEDELWKYIAGITQAAVT